MSIPLRPVTSLVSANHFDVLTMEEIQDDIYPHETKPLLTKSTNCQNPSIGNLGDDQRDKLELPIILRTVDTGK